MLKYSNVWRKNVEAYKEGYKYIINKGGSSSTKTFSILQLLTEINRKYKLQIDIVGQTGLHLRTGVLNDMPAICQQFGIDFDNHYHKSSKIFKLNGTTNFLSFDKLGKAHGGRRDILYLNEANHIPYPIVEQLMIRTRQMVFIDYNPTNKFWVHELIKNEPDKCKVIHSTYKDNIWLEQSIVDKLESRRGNNNFWRVYGLGEDGISEGLVFDNFIEESFDKERFAKYYHGVDWGFSNDPFAYVRCAVEQDTLYICDEIHQKGLLNKESAPLVKEMLGSDFVTCDSAEPKSVAEYRTVYRINAISAKKGKGSVESGIKQLQEFKKIIIHPSCPNAVNEFQNYQWMTDNIGGQLPKPIDAFNHIIDGARYALENLKTNRGVRVRST